MSITTEMKPCCLCSCSAFQVLGLEMYATILGYARKFEQYTGILFYLIFFGMSVVFLCEFG